MLIDYTGPKLFLYVAVAANLQRLLDNIDSMKSLVFALVGK